MQTSLYAASVPVLMHYLERMHRALDIACKHSNRNGSQPLQIITTSLTEGMFPFAQQVSTACGFAYRTCCPLLSIDIPPLAGGDNSLEELQERISATLRFLDSIHDSDMSKGESLTIATTAGFAEHTFAAQDYVLRYAMPNFFFHLTMAYAILRAHGVPLGKGDFDGYHAYPSGFQFPGSPSE
ncbi:MAG TPA: DUF1993 domain-containing protein [Noviherbaspirillum sp.]